MLFRSGGVAVVVVLMQGGGVAIVIFKNNQGQSDLVFKGLVLRPQKNRNWTRL